MREFVALAGRRVERDDEPNRHGLSYRALKLYHQYHDPPAAVNPEGNRALPTDTKHVGQTCSG